MNQVWPTEQQKSGGLKRGPTISTVHNLQECQWGQVNGCAREDSDTVAKCIYLEGMFACRPRNLSQISVASTYPVTVALNVIRGAERDTLQAIKTRCLAGRYLFGTMWRMTHGSCSVSRGIFWLATGITSARHVASSRHLKLFPPLRLCV